MKYRLPSILTCLAIGYHVPANAEQQQPSSPAIGCEPQAGQVDELAAISDEIECYAETINLALTKQRETTQRLREVAAQRRQTSGGSALEKAKVDDGLDANALMGGSSIPKSSAPDVVGAFRFLCGPGQLSYNDPLVYPGQKGKSHLHQFFGNLEADENSTYESLRASGESTCTSDLNRSAYWIPALLTGDGNVVRPRAVSVYYKRRPASDEWFEQFGNEAAGLPRGLSYIFGWDSNRRTERQYNASSFKCSGKGKSVKGTMSEVLADCPAGSTFIANITSPDCWNGKDLTASDNRSHMARMKRDRNSGKASCSKSHRYVLPKFTLTVVYDIEAGDVPSNWMFASDHMVPEAWREPGYSFHADWFGAWNDEALAAWQDGCIDKQLNCSDGNLGTGKRLKRNAHYPGEDYERIVPVPARP
ncbi:DUF1996 domain-containing protein [Altererythrobacter aurantiacus]|uniref:DUF1996 domain-containing protein n=1 Tax=Parapontixanthobacter aurantiacus TaxID=1463599 RepID=A0A844Z9T1_9SPHN|nr:DUF1996 domain-containing protein [Parapontixanthobacter aurantiacus]MXO84675.1 DUF1996 domain-containing protein [Parapontixanthobacter aurantiacus]